MCGIVGIIGKSAVADRIVGSLKLLEYRGYDSAGISVIDNKEIAVRKVAGRIDVLVSLLEEKPIEGFTGIGHTRWATHGAPEERNAHPFQSEGISIVHNGIIENYATLKSKLIAEGTVFESDTDTEVLLMLIKKHYKAGMSPYDAVSRSFKQIEGAFAAAVIFADHPDLMIGIRKGAPLAIGIGDGEMYLGSDALALHNFTTKILYLDDGEIVEIFKNKYRITTVSGREVHRDVKNVNLDLSSIEKGVFGDFMLKEIFEQSFIADRLFKKYCKLDSNNHAILDFAQFSVDLKDCSRIYIIACGSSYHAAFVAKYWFEEFAKIPVEIDFASEFRYRHSVLDANGIGIFISQSGETADTLAALKHMKLKGLKTLAIVNVEESSMAHEANHILPIFAGYEIGVASTKAFVSQMIVLALLCLDTALKKNLMTHAMLKKTHLSDFADLPTLIAQILEESAPQIKQIADSIKDAKSMIYIGRGASYPIALEGALKIKEISYIHAEAIAAGELKHGSIALIDDKMPVVAIAPYDELFAKTVSNVQEINARHGKIIAFTDDLGFNELKDISQFVVKLPRASKFIAPIIYTITMQLLAYYTATALGRDVDKPRNLAKSVTVE
ncbi:MAG: glutamine--fructose-6-phosphate transaminase (isomerizing) [Candidatus Jidaibacter sp.]|jgi:glucosamine--fructose-6-phosphate aminotransferase (isomerizing)|nr:glutamine--fructose-6-phosphate transaminase (isomerizing) [Candidatus Jidaibacter sp.]